MEALLLFAGAVNLVLLIWFVLSINKIKSELAEVKPFVVMQELSRPSSVRRIS